MLNRMTLDDLGDLGGRRALVRADFNVPMADGAIMDDSRIRAALPTIERLLTMGARVVVASHLGRPGGRVVESLRMRTVAEQLGRLVSRPVSVAPDCVGDEVDEMSAKLGPAEILVLENTRFHPGEEANSPEFARALAKDADVFVFDAFASAHRAHASTVGVASFVTPSVAGLLVAKEILAFDRVMNHPARPLVVVMGGAKIADKIGVVRKLLSRVDFLLIGGAVAYSFLRAEGVAVGDSPVETGKHHLAASLLEEARAHGVEVALPIDHVVRDRTGTVRVVEGGILDGWRGVDIGPLTVKAFSNRIRSAATVVWVGPMGAFERKESGRGTFEVAEAMAESEAATIVGGGETIEVVRSKGLTDCFTHVSTGGGASLAMLAGQDLPAISALTPRTQVLAEP